MRYCLTGNLQQGDRLAKTLFAKNGTVLLQHNTELTWYLINRIKTLNMNGVFIFDTLSSDIITCTNIPLDTLIHSVQQVSDNNLDNCIFVANQIVDNISNTDTIVTDLSALGNYDDYTYLHSVNVATYCALVGILLDLSNEQIKQLTLAGLLHDIGKGKIPINILNKHDKLSDDEREIIKTHAQLGYDILKENNNIASTVRVSVLEHHENWDGTGYPLHKAHSDIYLYARIIHVVDVYDALITERAYKEALKPNEVIEYLYANSGTMFDPEIVGVFTKNLTIYPDGSLVRLTDGTEAIVYKQNKEFPLRPLVKDFDGTVVDLLKIQNLAIDDFIFK